MFGIKPAIAPREVLVVDLVLDADIMERCQPAELNAARDIGSVRDEVIEQPEDVRRIRAIWRRGQPEQECRIHASAGSSVRQTSLRLTSCSRRWPSCRGPRIWRAWR